MFKYLTSYFWGNSYDEQSLDDAYAVLDKLKSDEYLENVERKFSNEKFEYSNNCVRKMGIITAIENGYYIIDDIYKCNSNFENLEVGAVIYFTVNTKNGIVEISDISMIADEWGCNKDNEKTSCLRTFVCKVNSRNGRQLSVIPGDVTVNLDEVSSEFVPIVGDWMEVEAKVELDENITDLFGTILQVDVIRPLRPRILRGSIRTWCDDTKTGSIDAIIFFTGDALISGYIPIIGDQVVTEVIDSDQGRYVCRSLQVIPEHQQPTNNKLLENCSSVAFETNVKGIFITDNININANRLNEEHTFSLQITNNLTEDLLLQNVTLPSNNFQCKIIEPTSLTNVVLKSKETINLLCLCVVKSVGITRELMLFSFENFKIGRWVVVNMKFNFVGDNHGNFKKPHTSSKTYFKPNNKDVIRGQKLSLQPRFTSNRLPDYPVPEKLLAVFYKCTNDEDRHKLIEDLRLMRPCLSLPFTFNIYEDRFHALVHLLEIDDILAMQAYRQDDACLIKNGEFLMLEIENLAERRPSLICGDQIIVKNSRNMNADEYEGVIHKIGAKHIYVKFSPIFHNNYNGERVAVMAISSRTRFRRMHQAIGLAIRNLGKLFLFPSKLLIKNPQTNFAIDNMDVQNVDIVQNESVKIPLVQLQTNTTLKSLNSNKTGQTCHDITNTALPIITTTSESFKYFRKDIGKNLNENFGETSKPIFKLEWYNKNLNFYQKQAIKNILKGEARPLPYIIFGPPGTGKTVTLVEVILQLIRLIPHSRLLIATPSNSAADLIATRLIDSGVLKPGDLIRLVAHHIVAEDAVPVHLIPYSAVADIARADTGAQSCDVKNSKLTIGYNSSVIGRHRITVGTCSALGVLFNMGFSKGHFTHIIVDEAGQLMEPEIMIPLSFLNISSGQVILAGDPLQLGPVITSQAASFYGLEETYMDRMMNRFPFARDLEAFSETQGYDPRLITQLLYNYRSLPLVLNLFNKLFYGSQLIATISSNNSYEAHLLNNLREILPCQEMNLPPSIVFHGVLGENYQTHDSPSWFNPDEASQIFFYVNELYRLGLKSSDIGIISPYIKQIKQIRSLLAEAEFQVPKIGTVEEFQGQEFNVILLSTVRSNYNLVKQDLKYKIGFISNPRRVNVAISRAKILMIIVGNPYLLHKDVLWRNIINYCIENKSCCGCDLQMLI